MKQDTIRKFVSLGLLLILLVVFSLTSEYFLTPANIFTLLREASIIGIVSIGVTFCIITAGTDFSTGANVALVSMICANFLYYTGLPVFIVLLIGVLSGAAAGCVNGFLVARLRLPDFIATLSTQGVFRGLTFVFAIRSATGVISNKVITNPDFLLLNGDIGGLYYSTIAFFVLAVVGQLILKRTKLGTYTYAVGADRKASEFSGINIGRVKIAAFLISGICSAVGGIFLFAKLGSAIPDLGIGLEFDVIAAVVVGGCAFSGGRGDVFGSVLGSVFLVVLVNGLYKLQMHVSYQLIIKGAIIILMTIFDSVYMDLMSKYSRGKSLRAGEAVSGGAQ